MGRNNAIKHFDPRIGRPVDLFASAEGRLPVVMELLKSPWIVRASELPDTPGGEAGKRVEYAVDVIWNGHRRVPSTFTWKNRRYTVDAVVQTWAIERWWWDRSRRVSRRCFRVTARGGVYDLAYDRLRDEWLLIGMVD